MSSQNPNSVNSDTGVKWQCMKKKLSQSRRATNIKKLPSKLPPKKQSILNTIFRPSQNIGKYNTILKSESTSNSHSSSTNVCSGNAEETHIKFSSTTSGSQQSKSLFSQRVKTNKKEKSITIYGVNSNTISKENQETGSKRPNSSSPKNPRNFKKQKILSIWNSDLYLNKIPVTHETNNSFCYGTNNNFCYNSIEKSPRIKQNKKKRVNQNKSKNSSFLGCLIPINDVKKIENSVLRVMSKQPTPPSPSLKGRTQEDESNSDDSNNLVDALMLQKSNVIPVTTGRRNATNKEGKRISNTCNLKHNNDWEMEVKLNNLYSSVVNDESKFNKPANNSNKRKIIQGNVSLSCTNQVPSNKNGNDVKTCLRRSLRIKQNEINSMIKKNSSFLGTSIPTSEDESSSDYSKNFFDALKLRKLNVIPVTTGERNATNKEIKYIPNSCTFNNLQNDLYEDKSVDKKSPPETSTTMTSESYQSSVEQNPNTSANSSFLGTFIPTSDMKKLENSVIRAMSKQPTPPSPSLPDRTQEDESYSFDSNNSVDVLKFQNSNVLPVATSGGNATSKKRKRISKACTFKNLQKDLYKTKSVVKKCKPETSNTMTSESYQSPAEQIPNTSANSSFLATFIPTNDMKKLENSVIRAMSKQPTPPSPSLPDRTQEDESNSFDSNNSVDVLKLQNSNVLPVATSGGNTTNKKRKRISKACTFKNLQKDLYKTKSVVKKCKPETSNTMTSESYQSPAEQNPNTSANSSFLATFIPTNDMKKLENSVIRAMSKQPTPPSPSLPDRTQEDESNSFDSNNSVDVLKLQNSNVLPVATSGGNATSKKRKRISKACTFKNLQKDLYKTKSVVKKCKPETFNTMTSESYQSPAEQNPNTSANSSFLATFIPTNDMKKLENSVIRAMSKQPTPPSPSLPDRTQEDESNSFDSNNSVDVLKLQNPNVLPVATSGGNATSKKRKHSPNACTYNNLQKDLYKTKSVDQNSPPEKSNTMTSESCQNSVEQNPNTSENSFFFGTFIPTSNMEKIENSALRVISKQPTPNSPSLPDRTHCEEHQLTHLIRNNNITNEKNINMTYNPSDTILLDSDIEDEDIRSRQSVTISGKCSMPLPKRFKKKRKTLRKQSDLVISNTQNDQQNMTSQISSGIVDEQTLINLRNYYNNMDPLDYLTSNPGSNTITISGSIPTSYNTIILDSDSDIEDGNVIPRRGFNVSEKFSMPLPKRFTKKRKTLRKQSDLVISNTPNDQQNMTSLISSSTVDDQILINLRNYYNNMDPLDYLTCNPGSNTISISGSNQRSYNTIILDSDSDIELIEDGIVTPRRGVNISERFSMPLPKRFKKKLKKSRKQSDLMICNTRNDQQNMTSLISSSIVDNMDPLEYVNCRRSDNTITISDCSTNNELLEQSNASNLQLTLPPRSTSRIFLERELINCENFGGVSTVNSLQTNLSPRLGVQSDQPFATFANNTSRSVVGRLEFGTNHQNLSQHPSTFLPSQSYTQFPPSILTQMSFANNTSRPVAGCLEFGNNHQNLSQHPSTFPPSQPHTQFPPFIMTHMSFPSNTSHPLAGRLEFGNNHQNLSQHPSTIPHSQFSRQVSQSSFIINRPTIEGTTCSSYFDDVLTPE